MKWYILWLWACILFAGCDDDNHTGPNQQVMEAFNQKFPQATHVEWEKKNNYLKAEFNEQQFSHTAWFDLNGQWYMTEKELNQLSFLPETVQSAFKAGEYGNWQTDDIDQLERLDQETIYVIEVKKTGQEYKLFYSTDGVLIRVTQDEEDEYESYLPTPGQLPAEIAEFIRTHYPEARIIEVETDHDKIEIDIIHQACSKEVIFEANTYKWLNTHYDIHPSKVPEIVMSTVSSRYMGYRIEDIEKYETPESAYYLFELEKGKEELKVQVDLAGNIRS